MKKILDKIPPALILFFIAPIFGELVSGSTPLDEIIHPVRLFTLAMLYGGGAVIIRELAVRWRTGWRGILLMGFAYGIFEEGLMVQSFFDPSWMDLGTLAVYGRVVGVNWVWTEHLLIFHSVISILASISFVEILYPQRRNETWVNRRGWWIAIWAGLLAIYLIWEIITAYDPGFWKVIGWASIIILVFAARKILVPNFQPNQSKAPAPFWLWLLGLFAAFGNFFIVALGSEAELYPFPVTMVLLAVYDLLLMKTILKWSNSQVWGDTHRISLINGALMFLLIITIPAQGNQHPIVYISNPILLVLLFVIAGYIRHRSDTTEQKT